MNEPLSSQPEMALAQLQSTSRTRLVVESIEHLMVGGELEPASKLSEMALSETADIYDVRAVKMRGASDGP